MQRMARKELGNELLKLFKAGKRISIIVDDYNNYIVLQVPLRTNLKDCFENRQMIFAVTKELKLERHYEYMLANYYTTIEGIVDDIVCRTMGLEWLKTHECKFDVSLINEADWYFDGKACINIVE